MTVQLGSLRLVLAIVALVMAVLLVLAVLPFSAMLVGILIGLLAVALLV